MRMQKLAAIATSVLTGGILITAVPSAAQAVPNCKEPVGSVFYAGKTIHLWWCDGTSGTRRGYHGQGTNINYQDQVYLLSSSGKITAIATNSCLGGCTLNTATVGDKGAPWAACVQAANVGIRCTEHGSA